MSNLNHNCHVKKKKEENFLTANDSGRDGLTWNICMKRQRNAMKFVELAVSAASLALVATSRSVWIEKEVVLVVCSVAVFGSFAFLISYVFALDELVSSTPWFIMETTYCTVIAVALLSCALVLLFLTTSYWADVNPLWHTMAALAAGSIFICSLLHVIDASLLIINWKRYSWNPNGEECVLSERNIPL
ncbi:hypothetical protein ANCCAN_08111 [Ancylostoma caninum]|uniref:MARVEL domain-containing protein n=1 Tax=Ancylostoma caninum TaxID=29170 RepID=A0A368GNA9_ANCCA|nr:hypothetical protein ANCCAN_08111 [Ancylostoma caninum]